MSMKMEDVPRPVGNQTENAPGAGRDSDHGGGGGQPVVQPTGSMSDTGNRTADAGGPGPGSTVGAGRKGKMPKSRSPVVGRQKKRVWDTPDLTDLFGPDSPTGKPDGGSPAHGQPLKDDRETGPDGRIAYEGWDRVRGSARKVYTPPAPYTSTAATNGATNTATDGNAVHDTVGQRKIARIFELTPEMCALDTLDAEAAVPRPDLKPTGEPTRSRRSVPEAEMTAGTRRDRPEKIDQMAGRNQSERRYAGSTRSRRTGAKDGDSVISQSSAADTLASVVMDRLRTSVGPGVASLDDGEIADLMTYAKKMKRDRLRTEMEANRKLLADLDAESVYSTDSRPRATEFDDVKPGLIAHIESPRDLRPNVRRSRRPRRGDNTGNPIPSGPPRGPSQTEPSPDGDGPDPPPSSGGRSASKTEVEDEIALGTAMRQLYHEMIWHGVPAGVDIGEVVRIIADSCVVPLADRPFTSDDHDAIAWAEYICPILQEFASGVDVSAYVLANGLLGYHEHGPTRMNGGPARWEERNLGRGITIRTVHRAVSALQSDLTDHAGCTVGFGELLRATYPLIGIVECSDVTGPSPDCPAWATRVRDVITRFAGLLRVTYRDLVQGLWAYHHRCPVRGIDKHGGRRSDGEHDKNPTPAKGRETPVGSQTGRSGPTGDTPQSTGPKADEVGGTGGSIKTPVQPTGSHGSSSTGPSSSAGAPPEWLRTILESQNRQMEAIANGFGRGRRTDGRSDAANNRPADGNPEEETARNIDDVHEGLTMEEHEADYAASRDHKTPIHLRYQVVTRPDSEHDYSPEDLHIVLSTILTEHLSIRTYARVKTLATVNLDAIHYNSIDCSRTVPKPVGFDINRMPALTGEFFSDTVKLVDICSEAAPLHGYARKDRSQVLQIVYRGLVKRYLPADGTAPKSIIPYVVTLFEMEQQAKHTAYEDRMVALIDRVTEMERTADKAFEHKASRELAMSESDKLIGVYYDHPDPKDGWRGIMRRLVKWCETRAAITSTHNLEVVGREDELVAGQLASCNAMLTERYTACLDRIVGAMESQSGPVPIDQTGRWCAIRAESFTQALASLKDVPMDIRYADRIDKELVRYLPNHPRTSMTHPKTATKSPPTGPPAGSNTAGQHGAAKGGTGNEPAKGPTGSAHGHRTQIRDGSATRNQLRLGISHDDDRRIDDQDALYLACPYEDDLSPYDMPEVPYKIRYDWTTYKKDETNPNPYGTFYRLDSIRMANGAVHAVVMTRQCNDRLGQKLRSGLCKYGPYDVPKRLCLNSLMPHPDDATRSACILGKCCPETHLWLEEEQVCAVVKAAREQFTDEELRALVEAQVEMGRRYPAKTVLEKEADPMAWATIPGNEIVISEKPDWDLLDEAGRHVFTLSTTFNSTRAMQPESTRNRRIVMPRVPLPTLCPPVDETVRYFRTPVA